MRRLLVSALLVSTSLGAVARADENDAIPVSLRDRMDTALEKGIALLVSDPWDEPFAYLFYDVFHRRFEVESLGFGAASYEKHREAQPDAVWLDVFRRVVEPAHEAEPRWLDPERGGVRGWDRMTGIALYCDQVQVPEDYTALLEEVLAAGGYSVTHVALALRWLEDNRCDLLDESFTRQVVTEAAALIRPDSTLSDLELEAAALVASLGRAELVPASFLKEVVDNQRNDGGWSESSDRDAESDWHPTVLAVWLLLEVTDPGRREPVVAR